MKRLLTVLVCVLSVISLLVGCAGTPAAPTATTAPAPKATAATAPTAAPAPATPAAANPAPAKQSLTVVRVGNMQVLSGAGVFVAQEKGYFKEQGIEVQQTYFDTGQQMIPALASGQLDVGSGAISTGLFNAIIRDIPLKIVAGQSSQPAGFGANGLVVRKDLFDSGKFKDYSDLKGKRIAIPAKGTASDILLDIALKKGNLTYKDVDVVEMPLPDMTTALANKSIDVALQNEPSRTISVAKGVGVAWKGGDQIYPGQVFTAWVYSPKFAENRELGDRFMVALLKGVRDLEDAFMKKDPKARAEIIPMLTKTLSVKDPAIYDKMTAAYLHPNGRFDPKLLEADQNWYIEHGFQKEKVDFTKAVDFSFVDYAVKQLGEYK